MAAPVIGVDLVRAGELDALLTRPWFHRLIYTDGELHTATGLGPTRRTEFLVGRFAAKEAVAKVLGTGLLTEVRPRHIAVDRTPDGAPVVRLTGTAARQAESLGLSRVSVSIAHKADLVIAVAIACPCETTAEHPSP